MEYSLNKYKYAQTGNKVIAISTYAGRTVRAVAKADPRDAFSLEDGKKLAAARCNAKIATKRTKNAEFQLSRAKAALEQAEARYNKMTAYFNDASFAEAAAVNEVDCVLSEI